MNTRLASLTRSSNCPRPLAARWSAIDWVDAPQVLAREELRVALRVHEAAGPGGVGEVDGHGVHLGSRHERLVVVGGRPRDLHAWGRQGGCCSHETESERPRLRIPHCRESASPRVARGRQALTVSGRSVDRSDRIGCRFADPVGGRVSEQAASNEQAGWQVGRCACRCAGVENREGGGGRKKLAGRREREKAEGEATEPIRRAEAASRHLDGSRATSAHPRSARKKVHPDVLTNHLVM